MAIKKFALIAIALVIVAVGAFLLFRPDNTDAYSPEPEPEYEQALEEEPYEENSEENAFFANDYFRIELLHIQAFSEGFESPFEDVPTFDMDTHIYYALNPSSVVYAILVEALSPLENLDFIGASRGPLLRIEPRRVYFEIGNLAPSQSFIIANFPASGWNSFQGLSFIDENGELRHFYIFIDENGLQLVGEFEDTRLPLFPVFIDEIEDEYDEFLEQFDYVHHLIYSDSGWGLTSIIWADEPMYEFMVLNFGSYFDIRPEPHIPIRYVLFALGVLPVGQALIVTDWTPINSMGITSGISFIDGDGIQRFYSWHVNQGYPYEGAPSPVVLLEITPMVINEMPIIPPERLVFYADDYFRLELLRTRINFHENLQDIFANIPIFDARDTNLSGWRTVYGYSILVTALSPLSSVEFIGVDRLPSAEPGRVYFEIGNLAPLQSFIIADYPIGFLPFWQGLSFIDQNGELRYFYFDINRSGITMAGESVDIRPAPFPVFLDSFLMESFSEESLEQFDYVHHLEYGDWGITSIIWADEPMYDFRVLHFGSYFDVRPEPHIPIREVLFELDVLPIGQAFVVEGWVPINSQAITSGISFIDIDGVQRFYAWQVDNTPGPDFLFDITLMVITEADF